MSPMDQIISGSLSSSTNPSMCGLVSRHRGSIGQGIRHGLAVFWLYQMENGRHFHLNGGPSFFHHTPPEILEIQEGTLQLRGGCARTRMRPRNIIHTTSRSTHRNLDERYPNRTQQQSSAHNIHDKTPRAPRSTKQSYNFVGQVADQLSRRCSSSHFRNSSWGRDGRS